jgi:hypothetical protein
MGVMWSQDSEYARERRRWESQHTEFGPGERPYTYQEFPLMMYRAVRSSSGGAPTLEHYVVENEQQERNMLSRGFVRGPENAVAALEERERGLAQAAAERAYQDKRMSEKAQQEAAAVDESTISHLGSIPETPIHKKGWPKGKPRKQVSNDA